MITTLAQLTKLIPFGASNKVAIYFTKHYPTTRHFTGSSPQQK